jgi:6-phosphogluconolactonase (cycloisomerase 2 family)
MPEIQLEENSISVDARLIGHSLGIDAALVQSLMREGEITSVCERGIDEDAGTYRLTFFHRNRRARFIVGELGNIIRRSTIDFGEAPGAARMRRSRL